MIEELRISDLGVIADANLELGPGFTVITGETGAGKTMVVTALGLLMGARSDASAVRAGAKAARVSGLVSAPQPEVREIVTEAGGEIDDTDLILTRVVNAEGRSRVSVGGVSAPVGILSKLAQRLFVVHGQNDQLRLRSAAEQRTMLDRFGGSALLSTLEKFQKCFDERSLIEAQLSELTSLREIRIQEATQLRAELEEIESVDPQPGEDAELKNLIERLGNLESLREASSIALRALNNEESTAFGSDAIAHLDVAAHALERVAGSDQRLTESAELLRSLSAQTSDVVRVLTGYAADLESEGPADLLQAHERLSALTELMRRYGDSAEAVIEYSSRAAVRLAEIESDDDRIGILSDSVTLLKVEESRLANDLTEHRKAAAERLSEKVTTELQQLALPDARFLAVVGSLPLGKHGADEVQLMLQPHPGGSPKPIAKSASGGELSRVMLALEVVVASVDPVPTFVFDEVDAGIGGAAAIEIGRRLAALARTSQVIVVTHLAQVAAFATNHLQVVKDSSGGFTESSCRALHGAERQAEIARLLSGLSDSENALAHAKELLELGAPFENAQVSATLQT